MASMFKRGTRWYVDYRPSDGGQRTRSSFATEAEAKAFLDEGSFFPDQRQFNKGNDMSAARAGRKNGGPQRAAAQVVEHIAANSALTESGCMEWQGPITNAGYGALTWKGADGVVIRGAHRLAYHLLVADVHPSLVIDHLCRNRACVRPDHLDMVIQRENTLRSPDTLATKNLAKTHCAKGHPFDAENTYIWHQKSPRQCTTRRCKTCQREYAERRRAARMGAAA